VKLPINVKLRNDVQISAPIRTRLVQPRLFYAAQTTAAGIEQCHVRHIMRFKTSVRNITTFNSRRLKYQTNLYPIDNMGRVCGLTVIDWQGRLGAT
jgi:hypothetical protein